MKTYVYMPEVKNDLTQTERFLIDYKKSLQRVHQRAADSDAKSSSLFYKQKLEKMDAMLVLGYMIQKVDIILTELTRLKTTLSKHTLKKFDELIGEQIKHFHHAEPLAITNKEDPAFGEANVLITPKNQQSLAYVQMSGDYLVDYIHAVSLKFLGKSNTDVLQNNHTDNCPPMTLSSLDWMILIPLMLGIITLYVVASMTGFFIDEAQPAALTIDEPRTTTVLWKSLNHLNEEYTASFRLGVEVNRDSMSSSDTIVYDDTRHTGMMCEIQNTFEGNKLIKKARLSQYYHTLFHHFPCLDSDTRTLSQEVDAAYMQLAFLK